MRKLIGACGCNCGDCRLFETSCDGCYAIKGKACWLHEVGLEVCDFYECSVINKGLNHCGECEEIPCDLFYKNKNPKWTDEYHQSLIISRTELLKNLNGRYTND